MILEPSTRISIVFFPIRPGESDTYVREIYLARRVHISVTVMDSIDASERSRGDTFSRMLDKPRACEETWF